MATRRTGTTKSGSTAGKPKATRSSGSTVKSATGSKSSTAGKSSAAKPASSKSGAGKRTRKAPEPNMQERIEGVQGWMAEIERRQGRMTYFGAAAAALAVVVSAVALFLAVTTKNDAATKDDLDQLTERVDGLKQSVTAATEKQLKATSETLGSLDQRIEALSSAQKQDAADIADLQSSQSATTGKNSGADKTGLGGGTGANSNNPGP